MYPSLLIATHLVPQQWQAGARLAGLAVSGALVMTAWDLVMDPLMVAGGYWAWEVNGAYFGVPLQNYWGWWLTTFITFALFLLLGGALLVRQTSRSVQFDRLAVRYQLSHHRTEQHYLHLQLGYGRAGAGGTVCHAAVGDIGVEKSNLKLQ